MTAPAAKNNRDATLPNDSSQTRAEALARLAELAAQSRAIAAEKARLEEELGLAAPAAANTGARAHCGRPGVKLS